MKYSNNVFGLAIKDKGLNSATITVLSDISEPDEIPVKYLFRNYNEMPEIEQKALKLCKGKVLDVGACGGCHTIHLQNEGKIVKAIDVDFLAVEVMKEKGVLDVEVIDFFDLENEKHDTILLLMNGVGIAKTINDLPLFFNQCKKLLNLNGQVLLDSSNIKYMFEQEDGSICLDLNKDYYGEVTYQIQYKEYTSEQFKWLFIDFEKLKEIANKNGFKVELIHQGNHYDYLAKLTIEN